MLTLESRCIPVMGGGDIMILSSVAFQSSINKYLNLHGHSLVKSHFIITNQIKFTTKGRFESVFPRLEAIFVFLATLCKYLVTILLALAVLANGVSFEIGNLKIENNFLFEIQFIHDCQSVGKQNYLLKLIIRVLFLGLLKFKLGFLKHLLEIPNKFKLLQNIFLLNIC